MSFCFNESLNCHSHWSNFETLETLKFGCSKLTFFTMAKLSQDLRRTPGIMLNWALAGAPYVACDIGGAVVNMVSDALAVSAS